MFVQHSGLVQITAPSHGITASDYTIILLLQDLTEFTRVWYYSALNDTSLNPHLSLAFALRDPYYPADPKPFPLELQRALLLPFGDVKGLYNIDFEGYHETIISELRKAMAIPYPTVQESCELATTLMEEGDLLLATNQAQHALDSYIKSFDAIHIKISGRERRFLADGHFADDIHKGRYAGQAAMSVRVVLRIRLVARVIHAYLRLHRADEAAFWGIRSLKLVRQGIDPNDIDDLFTEFVGSYDIARIYTWTATALTLMGGDEAWIKERDEYERKEGSLADMQGMWRRAELYLSSPKAAGEKKMIVEELKKLKVKPPAGIFTDEMDEVDSMRHLDLGAIENL